LDDYNMFQLFSYYKCVKIHMGIVLLVMYSGKQYDYILMLAIFFPLHASPLYK
jgi:hypothetical protein